MSLRVTVLLLATMVSAILFGCAEVRLGTISAPPHGSSPRVYIQPVSTIANNTSTVASSISFPSADDAFARKQLATLKPVLAAAGYHTVAPKDVKLIIGTETPDLMALRRGEDWEPTIKIARALHADYALVVERQVDAVHLHVVEYRHRVILINVATQTVYEQQSAETVPRLFRSQEERKQASNQKLYELYKKLFLDAKDEPFALAVVSNFRSLKKIDLPDEAVATAVAAPKAPPGGQGSAAGNGSLEQAELDRIAAERIQLAELRRQMSEQSTALQREKEEAEQAKKAAEQTRNKLLVEQQAREGADRQRAAELALIEKRNRALAEAARMAAEQPLSGQKDPTLAHKTAKREAKPPVFSSIRITDKEGLEVTDRAFSSQVIVRGQVEDESGVAAVFVNGTEAFIDEKGAFSASTLLKVGANDVLLEAYNVRQGKSEKKVTIVREKGPPPSASADISAIPEFRAQSRSKDFAVVIGIEQYRHIPQAQFAAADAALVKEYLKATGIPERNIAFLSDGQATLSDLKKTLERWLVNRVNHESRVIVYFSGHGAPAAASGNAFLVPFEGDPNYLEDTAYPLKRLYENLGKLPARQVTVLLDSCFSGAGGRSVLAQGSRPIVMSLETFSLPANVAVLTAARESQISTTLPERKHGLFTYHLLRALKQGKESLPDVYEYLKNRVEDDAKSQNVQQIPSLLPVDSSKLAGFSLL